MKPPFKVLLAALLLLSACKRSGPDAKEWFIVKGRLIDKCSGGGIPMLQKLEVYNELKNTTVGTAISNADGTFLIRCDLYRPYESVYMLFKNASTTGNTLTFFKESPTKNGDTVDFGNIEFGYDLYTNIQLSLKKFSPSDTFYLGYHADVPILFYPIPPDGIINYAWNKYITDFYYDTAGIYWSWGLGKAAFEQAVKRGQRKIPLGLCKPDTIKITVP